MKKIYFMALCVSLLSLCFVACKPNEQNEPKAPITLDEVYADYQSYLSDCYTVEDKIKLQHNDGTTETFMVGAAECEYEKDYGVESYLLLKATKTDMEVEIELMANLLDGQLHESAYVYVDYMGEMEKKCEVVHNGKQLCLKSGETNYCILEKGKGLTSVTDKKGNTWTLVE